MNDRRKSESFLNRDNCMESDVAGLRQSLLGEASKLRDTSYVTKLC
jgi:hypothetical protein